jgi:predicted acetyltransferase
MDIQILAVPAEQGGVLENLMHLYLYDFSEYDGGDVDAQGRFIDEHLHLYWVEPGRYPFLVQVDGKNAGFVLVRQMSFEAEGLTGDNLPIGSSPAGGPLTAHSIAEFFIMRKYRRQKVGQQVAWWILDRFPGRWLVSEVAENLPAQDFWRKIISEYTNGNYHEVQLPGWGGPTQEFFSRTKP